LIWKTKFMVASL